MKGQELKRRIVGADETIKITRAMHLIAASKITKVQTKVDSSRTFVHEMKDAVSMLGPITDYKLGNVKNPKAKKVCIIVSSDKGLCGDYNHKVFAFADEEIKKNGYNEIYAIGQSCREYYLKKKVTVSNAFIYMMQEPFIEDAMRVADVIIKDFIDGKSSRVDIIYTYVEENSKLKNYLVNKQLLPIEPLENQTKKSLAEEKIEGEYILYQYVWARIYYALCSASLALNGERMVAMQKSTNNGKELKDKLSNEYNHIRQESITNELIDAETAKRGRKI